MTGFLPVFLTGMFRRLARRALASIAIAVVFLLAVPSYGSDIPALMKTVEELRGRKFLRPVAQKTISRADLRAYLQKQMSKDLPVPVDRYLRILTALHLIDTKTSVDQLLNLYEEQVLAFYDPESHVFYSLSEPPSAMAQFGGALDDAVVVHELTHALQDQLFNAGNVLDSRKNDWDGQLAYQSVMEGEATLVMMAYTAQALGGTLDDLTASNDLLDTMASLSNTGAGIPEGTPKYFVESLKFPYMEGLRFVTAAYRKGKWDEIDRIDRCPPRTTEEISDLNLYWSHAGSARAGSSAAIPATPVATSLGSFHWTYLLGAAAAKGWRSDRVTFLENPAKQETILADTTWDSPADAARFRTSYEKMLVAAGEKPQFKVDGARVRTGYGADAKAIADFLKSNNPAPAPPAITCVK